MFWGYEAPITISELIWVGVMLIPLIIFSVRYAYARNAVMQKCILAVGPSEQYFHCFHYLFQKDDEELNKKWDEKLKNVEGWQRTLCIYDNPKKYKEFVKETMIWKEKNWRSVGVSMSGSIIRVLGLHIFVFGVIFYPLIIQFIASAIHHAGIGTHQETNMMAIFTIVFGIIITKRLIRLHKSTEYHKKELDAMSNLADDNITEYDNVVRDESVTSTWKRRGYYIQKMREKYFTSDDELIKFANDPINVEKQRLNLAQRITDDQISPWYRKPVIDKYEEEEDGHVGFADTENLMFGVFILMMIILVIAICYQVSIFINIFGIAFDFLDWLCHIGQNIGG